MSRSVEMTVVSIIGDVVMVWLSRYLSLCISVRQNADEWQRTSSTRVECYLLQLAADGADCWLTRPANRWVTAAQQPTNAAFLSRCLDRPDHPRRRESRDSVLIWLLERHPVVFIKLSVA